MCSPLSRKTSSSFNMFLLVRINFILVVLVKNDLTERCISSNRMLQPSMLGLHSDQQRDSHGSQHLPSFFLQECPVWCQYTNMEGTRFPSCSTALQELFSVFRFSIFLILKRKKESFGSLLIRARLAYHRVKSSQLWVFSIYKSRTWDRVTHFLPILPSFLRTR